MKIRKTQLRRLVRESIQALRVYDAPEDDVNDAIEDLCDRFHSEMMDLFQKDPDAFAGRSSRNEWIRAVELACNRLRDDVAAVVSNVEEDLHGGEF